MAGWEDAVLRAHECQVLIWVISCCRGAGGDGVPEYIVVTVLVAASGKLDLPKVTGQDQLVKALNKLAAIREEQVRWR